MTVFRWRHLYLRALSAHGYDEHAQLKNNYRTFIFLKNKLVYLLFFFNCFKPVYFYKGVIMEFTDIAMELSKGSLAGFLSSHPFILQLQRKFRTCHFRYYLIQDAYYLKVFSKSITFWLIRLQNQENERLFETKCSGFSGR